MTAAVALELVALAVLGAVIPFVKIVKIKEGRGTTWPLAVQNIRSCNSH